MDAQYNLAQLEHIFSVPADKRPSGLKIPWNLETDGSELLALHIYIHKHLRSMPDQLYAINLEIMLLQAMQSFIAAFSDATDPQCETTIMKRLAVACARRNLHLQKLKKTQNEATERTAPRPTTSA